MSEQNSPMRRTIQIEWESAMSRFFEKVDAFAHNNSISEAQLIEDIELQIDGNAAEEYTEWSESA